MGNSTRSLQSVMDYASTIGDLNPVFSAGGFTNLLALQIASDVMTEMIAQAFNWKFNRLVVPPLVTISSQQDYASINQKNIGWLEHGVWIDINNTQTPKPVGRLTAVRDLERTSRSYGPPQKVCWQNNDQLVQGTWPGAGKAYVNPVGATVTPQNPPTNILDANGNILVLTTYGVTGNSAPAAAAQSASGVTVNDGTCVWTVADPKAQGFRIDAMPSPTGVAYQIYVVAQARPLAFSAMEQLLDPIPDDYAKYFQDGVIAFLHRHSAAPVVRNRFEEMRRVWMESLAQARGQGDREMEDAGFVPTRGVMEQGGGMPIGPAWPFWPTW